MTAATVWLEGGKVKLAIENQALRSLGRRIRTLLGRVDVDTDTGKKLLDILDYVLGALCALMYAAVLGYEDRPKEWDSESYREESLLPRATDMSAGWLRIEGKWAAGLHFNSALVRMDAAHERVEALAGMKQKPTMKTRPSVEKEPSWCADKQTHKQLIKIYKQVGRLKHKEEAIASGRIVLFADAVEAFGELVALFESIAAARKGVVS
jgi:hypothetical protein